MLIIVLSVLNVYRGEHIFFIFYFFSKIFIFFYFFFKKFLSTFYFLTIFKTVITKMLLFCEYDSYFYVIYRISKWGFEHTFFSNF